MTQATARVTKSLAKNLSRRGKLPAFVTSLVLLAFICVQVVLSTLVGLISAAQYQTSGLYEMDATALAFQNAAFSILMSALPFAFGVFVSLWILAPISDELVLRFVIARGLLAGAVGFVITLLVGLIFAFVVTVEGGGMQSTLGYAFPWAQFADFGSVALNTLVGALNNFVGKLPHVMLAAVLLWHWLRTHERTHSVSGILDEV
jgi:hypothetical protein